MVVGNTFFKKDDENLITYKSRNCETVIDYAVVQKEVMKEVKDIKVIPGVVLFRFVLRSRDSNLIKFCVYFISCYCDLVNFCVNFKPVFSVLVRCLQK